MNGFTQPFPTGEVLTGRGTVVTGKVIQGKVPLTFVGPPVMISAKRLAPQEQTLVDVLLLSLLITGGSTASSSSSGSGKS
jgi:hypothetical protein